MPIVGKVIELQRHPKADQLVVAVVDVGGTAPLTSVVETDMSRKEFVLGDHVLVVQAGGRMPDGRKVRIEQIRGIRSEARMLSYQELNRPSDNPTDVIVLSAASPVGSKLSFDADETRTN